MYKLDVKGSAPNFNNTPVFNNFYSHICRMGPWPQDQPLSILLKRELAKFNATFEYGTGFLLFETEEDATAFVLSWA